MNENTFVDNFFFCLDICLSHCFSFLSAFCLHFKIIRHIVKLLIAVQHIFVEVQLKKENLTVFFGARMWVSKMV